ncbi:hypothetical protein D3C73_1526260 [compost metagenome]
MTGEERAERTKQEADADRRERDQTAVRAERFEEQLPEDQADGRGVDEEVVPLDRGADDGGEDDAAAISRCRDGTGGGEPAV